MDTNIQPGAAFTTADFNIPAAGIFHASLADGENILQQSGGAEPLPNSEKQHCGVHAVHPIILLERLPGCNCSPHDQHGAANGAQLLADMRMP